MDPLCLAISDSQPCRGTLCGSLRRKVTPLICCSVIKLGERESLELHDPRASFSRILQSSSWIFVWVGETYEWEKPVKSYKICPWNNQRPNQFVQWPREASGLQRNVCSGRSLSVHPSPYLRQTHNQSSGEKRWLGGMWPRRGTKNSFYFLSFLSFISSQFLRDVEMHINFHIFHSNSFIYIHILLVYKYWFHCINATWSKVYGCYTNHFLHLSSI